MKTPPPDIYTNKYYKNHSVNFSNIVKKIKPYIRCKKELSILDLGCGAGDLSIYLASKSMKVIGVDYSKDAISIAKKKSIILPKRFRNNIKFHQIDARNLDYKSNFFDLIISVDVFEHISKDDLETVMCKISRILKQDGKLIVLTEPNKIYLDFTHKYYVYPISTLLVLLNKLLTKHDYPNIFKDPRNELHKEQHVNEPTKFYLNKLFKRHNFKGEIISVFLYKPLLSWKDALYNMLVFLYPLSKIPPLSYLFEYDYICVMKNKKHS